MLFINIFQSPDIMPRHSPNHHPNNTSLLLLLLLLLFTTNTLQRHHLCYATDEATSSAFQIPYQSDDAEDNLSELTNAELESICTSRGFELSTSSSSDDDVVYTHQDYVDAARECLAIEAEMERVMKDNPEIMKDLKDEAERLMEEKRRLEEELVAKKSEYANKNAGNDGAGGSGGGGGGGAFIRSSGHGLSNDDGDDEGGVAIETETVDATTATATVEEADETTTGGDSDGKEGIPMSPPVTNKKPIEMSDDDSILDLDNINDDNDDDATTTTQEIIPPQNNNEPSSTSTTAPPPNNTMNMTMTEFIRETFIEFRKQLEHDVERVVTVVLPKERREALLRAVGPLLITAKKMGMGAFDLMKRYIEALLRDNNVGNRDQESEEEGVAAA